MDRSEQGWFDGHLDLAYLAVAGRAMELRTEELTDGREGALKGPVAVTLPSLTEGNVTTAIGTIFVQPRGTTLGSQEVDGTWCYGDEEEAYASCLLQLKVYQKWARGGQIDLIGGGLRHAASRPALKVLMMLEGGAGVRTVEDLRMFYEAGVRVMSLAWAHGSKWAGGNSGGGDMTVEGKSLVAEMNRLGMVHDVSHLSETAFWTMMGIESGRPKVATHSNCRALLNGQEKNERHLTDKQITAITAGGGIIGINLFTKFLAVGRRAVIGDVVKHVRHVVEVAGRADCIGLGSDMDGGFSAEFLPERLEHPQDLPRLAEALSAAGFSGEEVAGFMGDNWRRYFRGALGVEL